MSIRSVALKQPAAWGGDDRERIERVPWPIRVGDVRDAVIAATIGSEVDLAAAVRLTEEGKIRLRVLAMLVRTLEGCGSASRLSTLYRGQKTHPAGQRPWSETVAIARAFLVLDSLGGRFVNDGAWRWIAPAKASETACKLAAICAATLGVDTLNPMPAWPDSFRPHRVAPTNWTVRLAAAADAPEAGSTEIGRLLRVIAQDRQSRTSASSRLLRPILVWLPPRIRQLLVAPHMRNGRRGDAQMSSLDEVGLLDALSYRFLWPLSPVAFLTPDIAAQARVGERQQSAYGAFESRRLVPLRDLFPGGLTVGLFHALANAAFGDGESNPRIPWARDWRSAWAAWLATGDASVQPILLPQGGFQLGMGGGRLSDDPLGGKAAYHPATAYGFPASPFASSAEAE